jgi:hypothetical protein
MPHLATFRKGWESENLARFILHKFSFLSQPTNVADDMGSDFFCTLFQIQKEGRQEYLMPKNSFVIQIKSNIKSIDVSDKVQYLNNLEIPFFVGVVSRSELTLTIYSGEFIQFLFSAIGIPEKIKIELCDRSMVKDGGGFFRETGDSSFEILFPKVITIGANSNREELKDKVLKLSDICSIIQDNIASKRSQEYIFKQYGTTPEVVTIYAGSGSVKVFRKNFNARLAEVFYNLNWVYQNFPQQFNLKEYQIYADLFHRLEDWYDGLLPPYLTGPFEELKNAIDREINSL